MIDNINIAGPWLQGSCSGAAMTSIMENSNPMQGVLRTINNRIQAWNGSNWQDVYGGAAHLDLSAQAKEALQWARDKMIAEMQTQTLAKDHPAVAEAVEMVRHAEERLKVVVALTKENKHEVV